MGFNSLLKKRARDLMVMLYVYTDLQYPNDC